MPFTGIVFVYVFFFFFGGGGGVLKQIVVNPTPVCPRKAVLAVERHIDRLAEPLIRQRLPAAVVPHHVVVAHQEGLHLARNSCWVARKPYTLNPKPQILNPKPETRRGHGDPTQLSQRGQLIHREVEGHVNLWDLNLGIINTI